MPEPLTREHFSPLQGERFQVHFGGAPLELILAEIVAYPVHPPRPGTEQQREPFSLEFIGPPVPILPQRIYALENDQFGIVEIFLVPLGPCNQGMRYQAIFN
jgi:hypothetical protein